MRAAGGLLFLDFGAQGLEGPTGPVGPQGIQGPTGPQGIAGPHGRGEEPRLEGVGQGTPVLALHLGEILEDEVHLSRQEQLLDPVRPVEGFDEEAGQAERDDHRQVGAQVERVAGRGVDRAGRPECQGGRWLLAGWMKVIAPVTTTTDSPQPTLL